METDRLTTVPRLSFRHYVALALGAAWLVLSVTQGGLSRSWRALYRPGPERPDARRQWSGPYFDALDVLAPSLSRGDSVAVVLAQADHPEQPAPPVRMYETIYRLYPARPDFYFRAGSASCDPWWFPCRAGEAPRVTGLWAHRFVLWADAKKAHPPEGCRPAWENSVATVYRAG